MKSIFRMLFTVLILPAFGKFGLNIAGFDAVGNVIASPTPATQASQENRFSNIIGSVVSGTVAVMQAVRQPTKLYAPAVTGIVPGSTLGASAAQANTTLGVPTWTFWLLGGAVFALFGAAVLMKK